MRMGKEMTSGMVIIFVHASPYTVMHVQILSNLTSAMSVKKKKKN